MRTGRYDGVIPFLCSMQLSKLRELFQDYRRHLQSGRRHERLHYWAALQHFQDHWDMQADDLPAMLDASFQNPTTRRLWKREGWEPKRMLLELAGHEPGLMRQALRDLLNEEKALDGRATRFVFYMDELLQTYRKAHPRSIDASHYLDDYEFIFLLLAFRYPAHYAPYDFSRFRRLLEMVLAPNIPATHDVERYAKVMRTLYKLMEKEEGLLALHRQRLLPKHFAGETLLPAFDFLQVVAD